MPSKRRLFILLAILVLIVHGIATGFAMSRLSDALDHDAPAGDRFAPSFAVAAATAPLYPLLSGRLPFLVIAAINSVAVAILVAFVLAFLRFRTIVSLLILVPLLVLGGMIGAAMWLEQRVARGWGELAPRPIAPAPRGDLTTSLGAHPIDALQRYLAGEIARGDDRVDPPPQEVEWFLTAHRADINALRGHMPATADPLQLYRIQKILLVDALQTRAWDEVQTAQSIAEWMLHEPHYNSVLYAMVSTENLLGVMRKLDVPPNASLPAFDPHQSLIDAIGAQDATLQRISAPWYTLPYARLCLAESAYSGMRQARLIRNLRGCSFELPAEFEFHPRVPFNPTGVLNGGLRYSVRANRLLLDLEGTLHVLAAKSGGQPPAAARCIDRHWLLEGNVLRLDPPLPATAPFLPTRHEISAPRQ